ncbi:MAG: FAD-dependent oxidoreductase, partial [Gammaproteobacteria bacterium]|nr:FAD-dependent oxidoreductase [Gammaproteobacteria bacterium]
MNTVHVDTVIFGGGIAGLWLLARLRQQGYNAVLLEPQQLGSGQTRYAQGIIHGGTKYALSGSASASAQAIANMPAVWDACLRGVGEVDLSAAQRVADHQYLWSRQNLSSRLSGFFASHLMRSRMQAVARSDYPPLFQTPQFKGTLYRLDEPIIDTLSVIDALAAPHRARIWKISWPDGVKLACTPSPTVELTRDSGEPLKLQAQRLIFAAGAGNATLLSALGRSTPAMQIRPLQMVVVNSAALPAKLFAHCLGSGATPRITITSHPCRDGSTVWYLGGQLAEEGARQNANQLIQHAKRELAELLPQLPAQTWRDARWATLPIDRAEPRQPDGKRPSTVFADDSDGIITIWPTKLALAPLLADAVITRLRDGGIS